MSERGHVGMSRECRYPVPLQPELPLRREYDIHVRTDRHNLCCTWGCQLGYSQHHHHHHPFSRRTAHSCASGIATTASGSCPTPEASSLAAASLMEADLNPAIACSSNSSDVDLTERCLGLLTGRRRHYVLETDRRLVRL
ncbi:unnamed protein product [Schistocephalus solidus]|uniref:Uncharacterized protein n=1 Tax=Schistocephalus solidus TaxID=70667 RepID=A0A183T2P6_SCHSO|nr:unnamed protein product [Schistocephalus solidus]